MIKKRNEGFISVILSIAVVVIAIILGIFLIKNFQPYGYECIKNGDCMLLPFVSRNIFPTATTTISVPQIPQPVISSVPAVSVVDCQYYNIDSIQFVWEVPAGVDGVEYGMSKSPNYEFSKTSQGIISQVKYDLTLFDDGILYFSARFKEGDSWGPAAVKYFYLDRTPPEPFQIMRKDNDSTNEKPIFTWNANNKTSSIAYYRIKIGEGDWFDANTIKIGDSYVLQEQSPVYSRSLTVRAYDFAGNFRDSSTNFQIIPKTGWRSFLYRWPLFLIVIAIIALVFLPLLLIYRLIKWQKKFSRKMRRKIGPIEEFAGNIKSEDLSEDKEEIKKAGKLTDVE